MPERESFVTVLVKPDGDGSILTPDPSSSSSTSRRATRHRAGWTGALSELDGLFA